MGAPPSIGDKIKLYQKSLMKTIILLIGSHVHEDHLHTGAVHTIF